MAAVLQVVLPIETIAAIQRGERLEQALQLLSITPHPSFRVINEIARSTVATVNAIPYVLVPKVAATTAPTTPPVYTPPTTQPDENTAASSANARSTATSDPAFTVTIVDGTSRFSNEEDFQVRRTTTVQELAEMYSDRLGASTFSFNFATLSGVQLDDFFDCGSASTTLDKLGFGVAGICKTLQVNWVVTEPKPRMISITFRNLMRQEETFTVSDSTTFEALAGMYSDADSVGAPVDNFIFYHAALGRDIKAADYHQDLNELYLFDGDIITVKPDDSHGDDILITIVDTMKRETYLTVKGTSTVRDLENDYFERTGMLAGNVRFRFNDYDFGTGSFVCLDTKLRTLGIKSHGTIQAFPASWGYPLSPTFRPKDGPSSRPVSRALSYATGFTTRSESEFNW